MRVEHIGDATLYLGDCYSLLSTVSSIDVLVTDPPYELVSTGGGIGSRRKYLSDIHNFTDSGFDMDILKQFDNWMVFCSIQQLQKLLHYASVRRWMLITWNKPNPTPLVNNNYLPDTEYIVHSFTSGHLYGDYRDRSRYIEYPAQQGNIHPNEKPLAVMYKCIKLASDEQQTVLDPFMGSGTTGVACAELNRKFIGIEIEPKYFDIACERIASAYKQPWKYSRKKTLLSEEY